LRELSAPGVISIFPADYCLVEYGGTWNRVTDSTNGNRMQSQTRGSSFRFTFNFVLRN